MCLRFAANVKRKWWQGAYFVVTRLSSDRLLSFSSRYRSSHNCNDAGYPTPRNLEFCSLVVRLQWNEKTLSISLKWKWDGFEWREIKWKLKLACNSQSPERVIKPAAMFYNWIRVICRHVKIHDIIPNIIFYALLTLGKTLAPTQHKHDIKLIKYLICVHPSLVASENG